jgi:hypothetical protein
VLKPEITHSNIAACSTTTRSFRAKASNLALDRPRTVTLSPHAYLIIEWGVLMLRVLKYAAILALVAGVIANYPDIKRYIRISTM